MSGKWKDLIAGLPPEQQQRIREGTDALMGDGPAPEAAPSEALIKVVHAAAHALRSYQYGNASPDLAEEIADACDAALLAELARAGTATSVLQPWVTRLPLRAQGTLLTAVRGCDLTPKYPLDAAERRLIGAIRYAFMNPADFREVDREPGSFFVSEPPLDFKWSAFGHYPQHWLAHVGHAVEVLAYNHPNAAAAHRWSQLYIRFCHSMHMNAETREAWLQRMTEDRIENGTVVS